MAQPSHPETVLTAWWSVTGSLENEKTATQISFIKQEIGFSWFYWCFDENRNQDSAQKWEPLQAKTLGFNLLPCKTKPDQQLTLPGQMF